MPSSREWVKISKIRTIQQRFLKEWRGRKKTERQSDLFEFETGIREKSLVVQAFKSIDKLEPKLNGYEWIIEWAEVLGYPETGQYIVSLYIPIHTNS
jgi:hypothetical protein